VSDIVSIKALTDAENYLSTFNTSRIR